MERRLLYGTESCTGFLKNYEKFTILHCLSDVLYLGFSKLNTGWCFHADFLINPLGIR